MDILFSVGEASADAHGARILRAIRRIRPDLRAVGLLGPRMRQVGGVPLARAEALAATGFSEVVTKIPFALYAIALLTLYAALKRPKLCVVVDLPDVNLPLAVLLSRLGLKVVYFIPPQLWAWRRSRIETIRKHIHKVIVVFPFEQQVYESAGVNVTFRGHPLAEAVDQYLRVHPTSPLADPDRKTVAVLPGSRVNEIKRHLSLLLSAASRIGAERILVARTSMLADSPEELWRPALADPRVEIHTDATYPVLQASELAFVASGTATVEATLLRTPMVVAYRMSPLSFAIARRLVDTSHIAMPNVLAGRSVVPEFVQSDASADNLAAAALQVLDSRRRISQQLDRVARTLGREGVSAALAHELMDEM